MYVAGDPTESAHVDDLPQTGPAEELGERGWFQDADGIAAQEALIRRDDATAEAALERLLAKPEIDGRQRGGAQVLLAQIARRDRRFEDAARYAGQARAQPSLSAIAPYLQLLEARSLLLAGDPDGAKTLLETIDVSRVDEATHTLALADAKARTQDKAGAIADYTRFLSKHPKSDRRHEIRLKLGKLALAQDDTGVAIKQFEKLATTVPVSEYGQQALDELASLERAGKRKLSSKDKANFQRRVTLAEAEEHLRRRHYSKAISKAKVLQGDSKSTASQRCRAVYTQGSATFKQRKRSASKPIFDRAIVQCKKAGNRDLVVKASYQSSRGAYAKGIHEDAARAFEAMAKAYDDHTYADDAWIKAGESWETAGKPAKARKAYESALANHPTGDMNQEARRRLLVQAFAEKRYTDALTLTSNALKKPPFDPKQHAKLEYFRGRALQELGRTDEAVDHWVATIEALPVGYAAAQAFSRLAEVGPDAVERGRDVLQRLADANGLAFELDDADLAQEIDVLARLGLGDVARSRLDDAGVKGWQAVAALDRAGAHAPAQRELANLGTKWRAAPPTDGRRPAWEMAHPLAFETIIEPRESEHEVPEFLTYAIMQTESRFDPGAVSWAGATGLVQLMPATAEGLAKRAGVDLDEHSLTEPELNLDLGMRYLSRLSKRWGGSDSAVALAIPSYNAGAGAVDKWLAQRGSWDLDLFIEAIPYDETRRYTQSVLGRWMAYRVLYASEETPDIPELALKIPARAK